MYQITLTLIRQISGIRGIVDDTLTQDVVSSHATAFSKIQPIGPILIARDTRPHGRILSDIISNSFISSGRNVTDYQVIPTPTAQFLIQHHQFAGGIVITASHNPLEWNGMKFINADGCFLNGDENKLLFKTADDLAKLPQSSSVKIFVINNGYQDHIKHTSELSVVDTDAIRSRKFTVVVDAVNGAASNAIPELLELLGCKVIRLHCTPDGTFPRMPEPLPENLGDLCNAVLSNKADLGLAIDPDGDRLAIVDDAGVPMGEENTLVLCADSLLSTGITTPLVTNLSTTLAVDRIASKYGIKVLRSAVGEINVVEMMKHSNANIGGEGNGGIILKESHLGRDAIVGAAIVLSWLSGKKQPLSQLRKDFPQFVMIKDKMNLKGINPESALQIIDEQFTDIQKDTTDGLKLIWEDKWVHIRKSNTEPIIRIYAEADSRDIAAELVEEVKNII